MRILTRYFLREHATSFSLSLLLFTFILLMDRIFDLINMVVTKGVGIPLMLRLLSYTLPFTLTLSLPMSALLAILLALGRFNQDNEITAIKASGISTLQVMTPLFITALILSITTLYLNDKIVPATNHRFKDLYTEIVFKQPVLKLAEHTFIDIQDNKFYFEELDKQNSTFKGAIIYLNEKDNFPMMITAERGSFTSDPQLGLILQLVNGIRHLVDKNDFCKYNRTYFTTYTLSVHLAENDSQRHIRYKSLREMTKQELKTEITRLQQNKVNAQSIVVEYHLRNVIPFACLAFAMIAIPLGLRPKQSSKSLGFGLSLILILLYYVLLITGITLGERGFVKPILAVWLPNIIIGAVGFYLSAKVVKGKL